MKPRLHPCRAEGCPQQIPRGLLMCVGHWRMVPVATRREVLAAQPIDTPSGLALAITDSKNGTPRMVPVHPRIAHLVRGTWPLPVTKWTVSKDAKAAFRAVGLGHARLHDLRHSAASEMINAGVDLYTVGGELGRGHGFTVRLS